MVGGHRFGPGADVPLGGKRVLMLPVDLASGSGRFSVAGISRASLLN